MISNQSGAVRAEVNEQSRLEQKGVKASGEKVGGSEWSKRIGKEQSEKSVK